MGESSVERIRKIVKLRFEQTPVCWLDTDTQKLKILLSRIDELEDEVKRLITEGRIDAVVAGRKQAYAKCLEIAENHHCLQCEEMGTSCEETIAAEIKALMSGGDDE